MSIYIEGNGKKKKYVAKGTIPLGNGQYYNYHRIMKGASSKQEAQAMELEFKRTYKNSNHSVAFNKKNLSLKELIQLYDSEKSNTIKSSTKQSNYYMSKFFEPLFECEVNSITEKNIKKVLDEKIELGLEVSYVNKGKEYINKVINFGIKKGILNTNPVQKLESYKNPDALVKEMKFYTPEEFKKFISCFPGEKNGTLDFMCYVIVNCLYFLGLRINECLALTRADINLKNKTVRINKTVFRNVNGKEYMITSPKTKNSIRTILIPETLLNVLTEYIEWFDSVYGITDNCFLFGIDHPIHPKNIRKRVKRAAEKAELPTIRLHDFRHSHASLLANSGMPINAIASRLGHSIAECQKTYIHLFKESEQKLVESIDKQFSNEGGKENVK